jgi:hypothetical protein
MIVSPERAFAYASDRLRHALLPTYPPAGERRLQEPPSVSTQTFALTTRAVDKPWELEAAAKRAVAAASTAPRRSFLGKRRRVANAADW